MPDLGDLSELNLWASIAFAFAGLELCAVLGGEVKDPRRTLPRSILISAPLIAFLYIAGTAAVLWLVPDPRGEHRLRLPAGAARPGRATSAGAWRGCRRSRPRSTSWATWAASGAWLTGPARVAFVIGLDRYFPPAFGRVHPRWQTPYVAILTQAVLATVFLFALGAGEGDDGREGLPRDPRHDAAGVLHPLHLPVRLLPGRAAPRAGARRRVAARRTPGRAGDRAVAGSRFTLFAMLIATVPPSGTDRAAGSSASR